MLLSRGFLYRREPGFVKGRKPDFLTFGRGRIWVEVKEFDPPTSQSLIGMAWEELHPRLVRFSEKCEVRAWVGPGFDQRFAKRATHLVAQEVWAGLPAEGPVYVVIPSGDIDKEIVRLKWKGTEGDNVQVVTPRSRRGAYGYLATTEPGHWGADMEIRDGEVTRFQPAYEVLDTHRPPRLILQVERSGQERVLRSVGLAEAQNVNTVDRLRAVIDDANEQLKNAQKHQPLPGVLVVYFDHLGGGDESELLRPCLGDLTVSIAIGTNEISEMFYGRNGVFRANKNTAISAISYRSRHYPSVSLVNPHALYPVKSQWLDGTVYRVENGSVRS